MRPTGGLGYRGIWGTWAIGAQGVWVQGVWATSAIGHMTNGAHGQWGSWVMGPMGDLNIFAHNIIKRHFDTPCTPYPLYPIAPITHMAHGAIVYMGYGVEGVWAMGAEGVWGTWVIGAQGVWGTRGMCHIGNGSHGQWDTGVWAMGPWAICTQNVKKMSSCQKDVKCQKIKHLDYGEGSQKK